MSIAAVVMQEMMTAVTRLYITVHYNVAVGHRCYPGHVVRDEYNGG